MLRGLGLCDKYFTENVCAIYIHMLTSTTFTRLNMLESYGHVSILYISMKLYYSFINLFELNLIINVTMVLKLYRLPWCV